MSVAEQSPQMTEHALLVPFGRFAHQIGLLEALGRVPCRVGWAAWARAGRRSSRSKPRLARLRWDMTHFLSAISGSSNRQVSRERSQRLAQRRAMLARIESAERDLDPVPGVVAVSYTHLTLPTNREV